MRLMTLTPGAGHLVHMPGHIFLQTGDFDLAADTNVVAWDADRAFIERTGATGVYPLMYGTHNIHFIAYARAQQGRYEEAKQAAVEMVANVGDGDREMQMLEGFRLYPMMIDLRFHRWDTIARDAGARKRPPVQPRVLALRARDGARGAGQGARRGRRAAPFRARARRRAARRPIPHQQQSRRPARARRRDARGAARGRARRPRNLDHRVAPRRDARSGVAIRRAAGVVLHRAPEPRRGAAACGRSCRRRSACSAKRSRRTRATAACCTACGRRCWRKGAPARRMLVQQQFARAWAARRCR